MKHTISRLFATGLVLLGGLFCANGLVFADDNVTPGTSISISPVSKVLSLVANTTYEDSFKVFNNGSEPMNFEVYAAPYSYTYSEADDDYKLGFARENNYTQITRWVSFKNANGTYETRPTFTAAPGDNVEVFYKITTPASIPAGGQYAVLFAHTLSGSISASGIRTEASPGLVVYGRASGETIKSSEISGLTISKNTTDDKGTIVSHINASGKAKNTGNVDFEAKGVLTVKGILGGAYYETPSTKGRVSVIPEAELKVTDEWEETPFMGLFQVTWKITAADHTEETSRIILIMPISMIIVMIILLTILIVWLIIFIRKRKERRSRFMV